MPCTSWNKETSRWLTGSQGWIKGSEHTISHGHPLFGGEFCTYRLAFPVTHENGEPLFDLDECEISLRNGKWAKAMDIRHAIADAAMTYPARITISGCTFQRRGFGLWDEDTAIETLQDAAA